jgi:hypothetical protein
VRALVLLFLVTVLSGCGGGSSEPDEAPEAFAERVVRLIATGDAGAAWDELHPAHQAAVPRGLYVSCEGTAVLGSLDELEVTGVNPEQAPIPGSGRQEQSTEVALSLTLDGSPVELDMHVFAVGGDWRWVIGDVDYDAYAAGRCPGAA